MAQGITAAEVLNEMRDIRGLDTVTAWPLAVGWWLLIILALVVLISAAFYSFKKYRYRKSWQYTSFKALQDIETELQSNSYSDLKQSLHRLSVEMRRIAMQAYSREVCAGLVGSQWLNWLEQHDPRKFSWQSNGQLLVNYQYMPSVTAVEVSKIQSLVNAAKQWVKKC